MGPGSHTPDPRVPSPRASAPGTLFEACSQEGLTMAHAGLALPAWAQGAQIGYPG